jgi:putative transposase
MASHLHWLVGVMARPSRLSSITYCEQYPYFLTMCTWERARVLVCPVVVDLLVAQFLRSAVDAGVAVIAYCVMPDHVHLLAEPDADTRGVGAWMARTKQHSGYAWSQARNSRLWQVGYQDRVLRSHEAVPTVIAYMLNNPVRAGLVDDTRDYPFWGSPTHSREELLTIAGEARHP